MTTQNLNTAEPNRIEQTGEEFEAEFELQGNQGTETNEPGEPGDVDEEAIMAATDKLLELDIEEDNLARLDRLEAEREAREKAPPPEEEEADDDDEPGAEGEEEEADEGEGEEEEESAEDEGQDEEGEDDEEGASPLDGFVSKLTPDKAQVLADKVLERHADNIKLTFKANGVDQQVTLKELKERAAGYMGQEAASRFLQAERQKIEGYEEEVRELLQGVQAQRQALLNYLTRSPDALVSEVLLRHSEPAYLQKLRDELDTQIEKMESDPMGFESSRRVGRVEEQLGQLMHWLQSGQARNGPAPKPAEQPTHDSDEVPEDFGYEPGRGYPKKYSSLAGRSLEKAAMAVGIPFDDVLDEWEAGGKTADPFTVLQSMVRTRYAETRKVERAKNQGKRPRPQPKKGGVRAPKKSPVVQKDPPWDSLEGELAREVAALFRRG